MVSFDVPFTSLSKLSTYARGKTIFIEPHQQKAAFFIQF
jgi:hypothetical protein